MAFKQGTEARRNNCAGGVSKRRKPFVFFKETVLVRGRRKHRECTTRGCHTRAFFVHCESLHFQTSSQYVLCIFGYREDARAQVDSRTFFYDCICNQVTAKVHSDAIACKIMNDFAHARSPVVFVYVSPLEQFQIGSEYRIERTLVRPIDGVVCGTFD